MGRRPKGLSADPPANQPYPTYRAFTQTASGTTQFIVTPKLLLPPASSSVAPVQVRRLQDAIDQHGPFQVPAPLPPSPPKEKLLLPKLPAGMKTPSKIVVISASDSGQAKVQILNTSRPQYLVGDEERKKKILTGEMGMAKNLLPKPPRSISNQPRIHAMIFSGPGGSRVHPVILTRETAPVAPPPVEVPAPEPEMPTFSSGLPHSSPEQSLLPDYQDEGGLHIINDDTDAVDGFGDGDDSTYPAPLMMADEETNQEEQEITVFSPQIFRCDGTQFIQMSRSSGSERTILPKPAARSGQAVLQSTPVVLNSDNGLASSGQFMLNNMISISSENQINPDDFRPPKRRKKQETSRTFPDPEPCPEAGITIEELRNQNKRKGRPVKLKRTTQELIDEMNCDCLAFASDGINLKCLSCNCCLTKEGRGYVRQIHKHLHTVKSHQARYELWMHQGADSSILSTVTEDGTISFEKEPQRIRGRYRKTPLTYVAELKSPWLSASPDGQILRCDACNVILIEVDWKNGKGKRSDVNKHLTKDLEHLKNVNDLTKSVEALSQSELGELMDAVVEQPMGSVVQT